MNPPKLPPVQGQEYIQVEIDGVPEPFLTAVYKERNSFTIMPGHGLLPREIKVIRTDRRTKEGYPVFANLPS